MEQDYFIYNGNKYCSGIQFKVLRSFENNNIYDLAYFIWYDTKNNIVWYQMAYTNQRKGCSMEKFMKRFGGVTGEVDVTLHPPVEKQLKDSQIPKLFIGWFWYIFLMIIATILQGAIIWWLLISVVFFNWRKEVIKKEGYYIEW